MCTVSWWREGARLRVWFNRDEQRSRAEAEPPNIRGDVIAPRDPEGGGTWIALDAEGTVHCVLNRYHGHGSAPGRVRRSRGLLPLLSAEHADRPLADWLDPGEWDGFHLLRIPLRGGMEHAEWDGRELRRDSPAPELGMHTSSSWNPEEVTRYRTRRFREAVARPGANTGRLAAYHRTPDPDRPAFPPMMRREDARTHSVSELFSEPGRRRFGYQAIDANGTPTPRVEVGG